MNDRKHSYESPVARVIVVKIQDGILQNSLDANRKGYGEAIPVEW